jgi:hypothetical protein
LIRKWGRFCSQTGFPQNKANKLFVFKPNLDVGCRLSAGLRFKRVDNLGAYSIPFRRPAWYPLFLRFEGIWLLVMIAFVLSERA